MKDNIGSLLLIFLLLSIFVSVGSCIAADFNMRETKIASGPLILERDCFGDIVKYKIGTYEKSIYSQTKLGKHKGIGLIELDKLVEGTTYSIYKKENQVLWWHPEYYYIDCGE